MSKIDLIQNREVFTLLWERASSCMEKAIAGPSSTRLHFDSSNIATEIFLNLIRSVAAFEGSGEFSLIVLDPDPFNYFNFHFGKYPGFFVQACHTNDDFFEIMMADPGDSPADAIGFHSQRYAVLPKSGDWCIYADRGWNGGTGVLSGPADVMTFARERFAFYENPGVKKHRVEGLPEPLSPKGRNSQNN
ncbi:hypothetical protein [Paraburkholderia sp. BCC1884]|uniref:hypothetical protein n=1 Tax=Paraburkholderia sp. BCC1884 TaxID=2562668 RepID=UPI0011839EE5|nr:hypothetical protein [Paraburkholderia sp. BCC1884]